MRATPIANTFFTPRAYLSTSDIASLNLSATNELCIRIGTVEGVQGLFVQVRDRAKAKRVRAKRTYDLTHESH